MSERPIIFSGPMVRAILEGRKTQTRRVFSGKGYAWWQACGAEIDCHGLPVGEDDMGDPCDGPRPYGVPGDTLWVRECFAAARDGGAVVYRADEMFDGCEPGDLAWSWKPSIHMPRWASRITLTIKDVRVQRVRDITEEDCIAEGIVGELDFTPQMKYAELWNFINAKRGYSWESNPWVWVLEFERQAGGAQ